MQKHQFRFQDLLQPFQDVPLSDFADVSSHIPYFSQHPILYTKPKRMSYKENHKRRAEQKARLAQILYTLKSHTQSFLHASY